MNQEKIGKFIAKCRKEKNMTQLELAEKLGVTDKSIGNWENARCMPDLSLFQPLCEELGISINDLISGERIKEEECQQKFEENIIHTIAYTNKKIQKKNNMLGLVIASFGLMIVITALVVFKSESSWSSIYAIVGVNIFALGVGYLIPKLEYSIRLLILIGIITLASLFLLGIDYLHVKMNEEAPRFAKNIVTVDTTIFYDTFFYDVYRCNANLENEYFKIVKNSSYTEDSIRNYCK